MYFHIIASGSKGNATVIVENETVILIDLGISKKRLIEGLEEIHFSLNDIDALFITHNHTDHVSGIKFISPKLVYGLNNSVPSLANIIYLYKTISLKDLEITPIETSHDSPSSCGYIIKGKKEKLVYITDTGIVSEEVYQYCHNPNFLILESNHDIKMLLKTNRTMECKQRIMSDYGHLSNEDSAFACLKIIGNNTKEVVLAHISEEANSPEIALEAYRKIFNFKHVDINKFKITVANQWKSYTGGER